MAKFPAAILDHKMTLGIKVPMVKQQDKKILEPLIMKHCNSLDRFYMRVI